MLRWGSCLVIVKRNFTPLSILPYVWRELAFVAGVATVVCVLGAVLPFGPLAVLGTALAIFLGFRNNSGYARWWEARTIWAQIVNSSRTLGRLIVSSAANASKLGKGGGSEAIAAYAREMVLRQIAFAHALRLHLRGEDRWEEIAPLLSIGDYQRVRAAANKPNLILQIQGDRLKDGVREERVGQFDPISIEPALASLGASQGGCERIKTTPLLRQYEFFTRVFLWTFLALLPPSILGQFPVGASRWATVPLSLAIGFVYAITNRTGQVTEDPFENRIHDIPMTAICNTIERDLREQLGEPELPRRAEPVDGYLW